MNRTINTVACLAAIGIIGSPSLHAQPCGQWELVDTPNPGSVRNFFVDAEETPTSVYALMFSTDSPQVRPPGEYRVLKWENDQWVEVGSIGNTQALGLEYNAITVAPDGTVWLGGLAFPRVIGRNPAPVVASLSPDGTWSGPEEIEIPDTVVVPTTRRSAIIESIESAPDGTIFASGLAQGFGGGQQGIDASVPLFLSNDGSGWEEVGVFPGQDWPGGAGVGAGTFLYDMIAFAADDVWAVGRHGFNGTISGGLILHWDGSTLDVERGGNVAGGQFLGRDLGGIDGNSPTSLRVAGENILPEAPFGTIGHFDGSGWVLQDTPYATSQFSAFADMDHIVVADDGTAWATTVFAGSQTPYYDGQSWQLEPFSPISSVRVQAMAEAGDGTLWAFGDRFNDQTTFALRLVCDTAPSCPADFNDDGSLNFFDISDFISAFNSGDLSADFDGDGNLNFFDVSAFLAAFSAGCP